MNHVESFNTGSVLLVCSLVAAVTVLLFVAKKQRQVTKLPWILSENPWEDFHDVQVHQDAPSYKKISDQLSHSPHSHAAFLFAYPSGESGLRVAKPEKAFSSLHSSEVPLLELNRIPKSQKLKSYSICDTEFVQPSQSPHKHIPFFVIYPSGESEKRDAKPEEACSSLHSSEDPFLELNRIVESQESESYSICDTDLSSVTRWTSFTTSMTMHRSMQSQNTESYSICDQSISI
jgi:hypothetical protein